MNLTVINNVCRQLKLGALATQIEKSCEQANRQNKSYHDFLLELLQHELDERLIRRATRYIKEAKFPWQKTLESFDFNRASHLPETLLRELSTGTYFKSAHPIILMGEPGTGKTHLACALGYCAAQQGFSVRFTTTSQLVNLLVEAKDARVLSSITQRYARYKLLILDELGYIPLSKSDSELLFQVITQRQERLPTIITTNLPFSEWTSIFPDHRLCRALIDRLTHRAHIIETGDKSIRFVETLKQLKTKKGGASK